MKYTAENFFLHYIPEYQLLIKSDFSTDTLIIVDKSQEVKALYSYPSDAPDAEATKILGLPFRNVSISLPLQSFTLVPSAVFDNRYLSTYQAFMQDDQLSRTHARTLDALGITGVFQYDLFLHKRWLGIFPQANFLAAFQVVLQAAQSYLSDTGNVLGIHLKDKQAEIFVFSGKELLLYNIFDVETGGDLQYFLLTICNSLEIQPQFSQVLLSGMAEAHPFVDLAQQYGQVVQAMQARTSMHSSNIAVESYLHSVNLMADFQTCAS
ncbi:DUF3822 family protein [Sphingobacterium griseoflavum]|uniref:DUF3822 domain-containing protein n=1 Tax=Sphingobacterium griseoflavum TaxID=1474952 RepID=A0ABQ3HWV9_9SPHI|nr:DUF3822 family protein [Sphingobacterium griseoflavum]GHE41707.1 hypothetical protein GCM10017764_26120 [Sphingobacterium griseoflavum]